MRTTHASAILLASALIVAPGCEKKDLPSSRGGGGSSDTGNASGRTLDIEVSPSLIVVRPGEETKLWMQVRNLDSDAGHVLVDFSDLPEGVTAANVMMENGKVKLSSRSARGGAEITLIGRGVSPAEPRPVKVVVTRGADRGTAEFQLKIMGNPAKTWQVRSVVTWPSKLEPHETMRLMHEFWKDQDLEPKQLVSLEKATYIYFLSPKGEKLRFGLKAPMGEDEGGVKCYYSVGSTLDEEGKAARDRYFKSLQKRIQAVEGREAASDSSSTDVEPELEISKSVTVAQGQTAKLAIKAVGASGGRVLVDFLNLPDGVSLHNIAYSEDNGRVRITLDGDRAARGVELDLAASDDAKATSGLKLRIRATIAGVQMAREVELTVTENAAASWPLGFSWTQLSDLDPAAVLKKLPQILSRMEYKIVQTETDGDETTLYVKSSEGVKLQIEVLPKEIGGSKSAIAIHTADADANRKAAKEILRGMN